MRYFVILFSLAAQLVAAAEPLFVTVVGGVVYPARPIANAVGSTVTAPLIYGGTGETADTAWAGKIVLLDRGGINFFEKVSRVQVNGGLAVVIANNVAGVIDPTLAPGTSTLTAVAITQVDGLALRLKTGSQVRVGVAEPPPATFVLPDPAGHSGEFIASDGVKYIFAQPPTVAPVAPATSTVEIGQPVSFGVSALGTSPFKFQWHKDGVELSSQTTAVLSIAVAKLDDAGVYICQVSNAFGTAPSGSVTLTVK